MTAYDQRRVHLMDGFAPSGRRVRAACTCGVATTPRVNETRALDALQSDHGFTPPVCALCGHDYEGRTWLQIVRHDLQILKDSIDGEFLACRDMPQACRDGADQRQMHLDREAFDAFGIPTQAPKLRVIPGGRQ